MHDVLQALHSDHVNIAKLIKLFEQELQAFEAQQPPDYQLMIDIMRYMTQYPDAYHHPKEELLFNLLLKASPGARDDMDILRDEHERLASTGQNVLEDLYAVQGEAIFERNRLPNDAREYLDLLRRHMRLEESSVFPLADALLRDADWVAIEQAMQTVDDPLFGAKAGENFRSLLDVILQRI